MSFHNAMRRLRIADTGFIYYSEGAYGVVFVDLAQKRIRKVYHRRADMTGDHCQQVFQTEIDAYDIASKAEDLTALVPTYFGPRSGQMVFDRDGNDVTSEFYPDLAFEAEFVSGSFQKIAVTDHAERQRVFDLFKKHRIFHMIDGSVCLKDGQIVKVVDFATKEVEPLWDSLA